MQQLNNKLIRAYLLLLLGNFLAALGITVCTVADMGVDPLTVLYQGMAKLFSVDLGVASIIVNILLIVICIVIDKKSIKLGTIFTVLSFSYILSILTYFIVPILDNDNIFIQWAYILCGIITMGIGFSTSIYANVGPSVLDVLLGLVLSISGKGIRICKMYIDIISLILGYLLGGSIGIGTVLSIILMGTVYESNLKFLKKHLKWYI